MFGAGPGRRLIGRPVHFAVVLKTSDISPVHILIKGKCWEFTFGTDDTLNFENIMLLCLIVDQESFFSFTAVNLDYREWTRA